MLQLKQGTQPCKLLDVPCLPTSVHHLNSPIKLREYARKSNCSIHLPDLLSHDSSVISYQAIISQTRAMVNSGDFVKVTVAEVDIYYNTIL